MSLLPSLNDGVSNGDYGELGSWRVVWMTKSVLAGSIKQSVLHPVCGPAAAAVRVAASITEVKR